MALVRAHVPLSLSLSSSCGWRSWQFHSVNVEIPLLRRNDASALGRSYSLEMERIDRIMGSARRWRCSDERNARARSWVAGCRATGTVLVPVGQTYGTVSTRTRCTMPDRLCVSLGVDGQVVCGHSELRRDTVDPALNLSNRSLRSIPHRTIVVSSSPLKKSPRSPTSTILLLFAILSFPRVPFSSYGKGSDGRG